jgi:hypothetical protein
MTNAEIMQIISEEMLKVAPSCCGYECYSDPALYEDEMGRPLCYDCAPDHKPLSALGRAYGALEKRFAG